MKHHIVSFAAATNFVFNKQSVSLLSSTYVGNIITSYFDADLFSLLRHNYNILTLNFDADPFSLLRHIYKSNTIHYYFNDDDSINKAASPKQ